MGRIKLTKDGGLGPVIPLCAYCGEPKDQVVLLGSAADRLAKSMGRKSAKDLPMHVRIPGDLEPCDKCRKNGIAVIVVDAGKAPVSAFLVKDEILDHVTNEEVRENIREKRVMVMPVEVTGKIGLTDSEGQPCHS